MEDDDVRAAYFDGWYAGQLFCANTSADELRELATMHRDHTLPLYTLGAMLRTHAGIAGVATDNPEGARALAAFGRYITHAAEVGADKLPGDRRAETLLSPLQAVLDQLEAGAAEAGVALPHRTWTPHPADAAYGRGYMDAIHDHVDHLEG